MHLTTVLYFAVAGVEALSGQSPNGPLAFSNRKRQLLSCEQTYGEGSVNCGGRDSSFCYKPNLGQSCCLSDFGFCEAGSYCAPVAGFCCIDGETLQDCAKAAGFDIPQSFTATVTTTLRIPGPRPTTSTDVLTFPSKPTPSGPAVPGKPSQPTVPGKPSQPAVPGKPSEPDVPGGIPKPTSASPTTSSPVSKPPGTTSIAAPSVPGRNSTGTGRPPFVTVNAATRGDQSLLLTSFALSLVALIVAFC